MRRTVLGRAVQTLLAVGLVTIATSCGTGGPDDPFSLFRRILLDALGHGQGTLTPGGQSLLFGPLPSAEAGRAAAVDLRLSCLSGPGVVQARLWYDDPLDGPTPAADSFGFTEDRVDLNLGAAPLQTTLGHFTGETTSRLYLEVSLPAGRPETAIDLLVELIQAAQATTFDLEPNHDIDHAVTITRQVDGSLPPSPGVMCPLFGDVVDYYRVLPDGLGDGLEVETVAPVGARTVVEVTDNGTVLLGGLTGSNVDVTPLLGEIPVVGRFFRTRTEDDHRQSLLVFINPHIAEF